MQIFSCRIQLPSSSHQSSILFFLLKLSLHMNILYQITMNYILRKLMKTTYFPYIHAFIYRGCRWCSKEEEIHCLPDYLVCPQGILIVQHGLRCRTVPSCIQCSVMRTISSPSLKPILLVIFFTHNTFPTSLNYWNNPFVFVSSISSSSPNQHETCGRLFHVNLNHLVMYSLT